ncbi:MAG: AlpA family phage regulatory protein [Hyphomicrobium sp.]|jgi:prophage regulatory protein
MARPSPPTDNICLDVQAVQHCVTYSLPQLTRLESAGKFPKRIELGPRRVGWSFREILNWMQSKVDARPVGPMSPKVVIDTADRFIHPKELRSMVLYSRNHVRRMEAAGRFPRHIWLSDQRKVWLEREVKAWLEEQRKRAEAAAARKTYHVQLCRPRFEVANVTVEAESSDAAGQAALALASASKSGWHLIPYMPQCYGPHIAVCDQDKCPKQSPHGVAAMLEGYHETYVRYLMLCADIKAGEGRVLFQPWFTDEKLGSRLRDLANDWVSSIAHCRTPLKRRGRPKKE